jgi:hypothetical protein
MLQLASQRGCRECAQHHLSTPGLPGNGEGARPGLPRQRTVWTLAGMRHGANLFESMARGIAALPVATG